MRKICIITGTRAEWGLLAPLAHKIYADNELQLQLIATGMHLSTEFGLTYRDINLPIDKKCEIILSADTPTGICKSICITDVRTLSPCHNLYFRLIRTISSICVIAIL